MKKSRFLLWISEFVQRTYHKCSFLYICQKWVIMVARCGCYPPTRLCWSNFIPFFRSVTVTNLRNCIAQCVKTTLLNIMKILYRWAALSESVEKHTSSSPSHFAPSFKQNTLEEVGENLSSTVWFYSDTKKKYKAGTEKTGEVIDGILGEWLSRSPPPAENESRSLTYSGGSSSSRLGTAWQVSVCGRHELWQLRLAGHANLHFTPEHMSRWGLFPLGGTGVFPFP